MEMPAWIDRLGGLIANTAGFWVGLGNLESQAHRGELDEIAIDRPIYVTGLARSGSTIMLELLASHPDCATHRYRDYPPIYTPLFWNRAFAQIYRSDTPAVERAHKDRILVTPDSPEAMEEVLWMRFFPDRHDTDTSQVLDATTSNPTFERFYTDHIRKILLVRKGRRYLAKGNYNISRLGYLLKLFPDARFLVPVREPRGHVASLLKQHRLFCAQESEDPRVLRHMQRVGHYEFGLDRRTLNLGDAARARSVVDLWKGGDDARGLARHWATVYGFVLDQLERDPGLARHVRIVRYEDACAEPLQTLRAAADHAELEFPDSVLAEMASRLAAPAYYKADFSPAEEAAIAEETGAVAMRLGYGPRS
ncbi:MAG: sulfotransferase [Geminicoccaceae bacterium]